MMKATVQIHLNASTPSEAQRLLLETCEKLKLEGFIKEYPRQHPVAL
jgi:hypothetical protein